MITEPTPLYDRLTAHRATCVLGLSAAQQCAATEELASDRAAYETRAAHYAGMLTRLDAQLAQLVTPIDRHGALVARRTGIEAQIVKLDTQIAHAPDDALVARRRELAAKAARLTATIEAECAHV